MTLDQYVAWAAGIGGSRRARVPEDRVLLDLGLGFGIAPTEVLAQTRVEREGRLAVAGRMKGASRADGE